jgi:hypothetical protein
MPKQLYACLAISALCLSSPMYVLCVFTVEPLLFKLPNVVKTSP